MGTLSGTLAVRNGRCLAGAMDGLRAAQHPRAIETDRTASDGRRRHLDLGRVADRVGHGEEERADPVIALTQICNVVALDTPIALAAAEPALTPLRVKAGDLMRIASPAAVFRLLAAPMHEASLGIVAAG